MSHDPTPRSAGPAPPEVHIETTACPECPQPGEVVDRFVLDSTDGPVEHLHVRCAAGHWFVLPVESYARAVRGDGEPDPPDP